MIKALKDHTFGFLLFLIAVLGAIPRGIELINKNYLFGFDQGLFYQEVAKIVDGHHLTLIGDEVGGIGGFFQGPGWRYLLVAPYILFRGDPYGAMVLMFLLGVGSILLSSLLFNNILGKKISLLIGFFIALSPGIISQSRFFWPPFVITPLALFFLFCVLKAYQGKKFYIPLAFLTLGFMNNFEIATGGSLLLASVVTLSFIRPKHFFSIKVMALSITAYIIPQLPLILFDIRHQFISSKGLIRFISHGSSNQNVYSLKNHLDMFKDSLLSVSGNLYFGIFIIFLISFAFYKIHKDKKIKAQTKRFVYFLVICPVILFVLFLPIKTVLWSWWFLELPVFLCVLLGLSTAYTLKISKLKYLISVFLILYFIFFAYQSWQWYRVDLNDYGGTAKIKGKIDAIDYIYHDAKGEKFGLLVFTPPVYAYPYDYILYWYGKHKYGYVPSSSKEKLFYLLIEKDPVKPTSYIGWEKTVVKTGKIIKTVTLPSGFIVEKRVGKQNN